MPTETQSATREVAALDTLVSSLRNTHALEKQTIAVLEAQLKLLIDYPDLQARVRSHIVETREQARRLEGALEACGSSASMVKDALLSVMGLGQSSVQGFAEDAVLKAVLADRMTEQLEIASYRTLIVLADLAGKPDLRTRLEETLREEEAMAEWIDTNLDAIVQRFVELKALDLRAEAAPQDTATRPDGETPSTPSQNPENAKGGGGTSTMPGAGTGPDAASEAPAKAEEAHGGTVRSPG